ncbi:MAG: molybdopterin molybdenumtransferase MoeA [Oscillospiraceae bacterium]|jgi:molybdopterin molybdotransferase/putative molybdopterin biosynthesis protein|nr:molybdopterin molybdenumtransferase MoeA [Oscillospiraceae bacterium]
MKKSSGYPTRAEVLDKFFDNWAAPKRAELVATAEAYGRVLSEDVFSLVDKPVFRASSMDGIAVKAAAFANGIPSAEGWKLGTDYVRADTGDDFPDEYDAVVQIEDVTLLENGGVRFAEDMEGPIVPGWNVTPQGANIRKGALIGRRGTKLSPCELAALSIGAVSSVNVFKKPVAVFIPTGNELVTLGTEPRRGQAVDSNSLMAVHLLREMGAEASAYPIVKDDKAALAAALDRALAEADIVVINAGTSKGEEDYCHALIADKGTQIAHGVAAAPGKPMALGIVNGKPVINVAGPPVACFNGLDWCVRPIVSAFLERPLPVRRKVKAKLAEAISAGGGERFEAIVRIELEETPEGYLAHPVSHRNRHTTDALLAGGLYVTKLVPEPNGAGDTIEVDILSIDN